MPGAAQPLRGPCNTNKRGGTQMDELDRFLSKQNIARYRKLLQVSTSENERAVILELLAEEVTRLKSDPLANNHLAPSERGAFQNIIH
jgi:hypothetical protein